jgi:hypothetical protein
MFNITFLNKNKMFKKNTKSLWAVMIVLIALVAIMLVMQAQVLMILQDLQASIFGNWDWYFSGNPLPAREVITNPLTTVSSGNPLPALVR